MLVEEAATAEDGARVDNSRKIVSFNISSISLLPMIRYVILPPFTLSLLMWILQSVNVVECPEFRKLLLLLKEDLDDLDIPHRTKLKTSIIAA